MSATRWSVAVSCAALLLTACGQQTASAPVIAVRAQAATSPVQPTIDASAIAAEFASQLADSTNVQPIGEDKLAAGELPIDSVLTLRQSERLTSIQILGFSLVSQRETSIARVRSQVLADPAVSASEKYALIAVLDTASAAVSQMGVTIANDQLVDKAHSDVRRLAALRIEGFVLPQARLLLGANDLVRLSTLFAAEQVTLQQQIYTAEAFGKNATASQAAVNDLGVRITDMKRASAQALALLQGLTVSGYPGNKGLLISARHALDAGNVAAVQGNNDAARARAALS
jgi:hypothetical protein